MGTRNVFYQSNHLSSIEVIESWYLQLPVKELVDVTSPKWLTKFGLNFSSLLLIKIQGNWLCLNYSTLHCELIWSRAHRIPQVRAARKPHYCGLTTAFCCRLSSAKDWTGNEPVSPFFEGVNLEKLKICKRSKKHH